MAFETRPNSGALFSNKERKANNPKAPDYTGNLNIDGEEYDLAAWIKDSKKGTKFMSLSVKPKQDRRVEDSPPQTSGAPYSDDIPFAPRLTD